MNNLTQEEKTNLEQDVFEMIRNQCRLQEIEPTKEIMRFGLEMFLNGLKFARNKFDDNNI